LMLPRQPDTSWAGDASLLAHYARVAPLHTALHGDDVGAACSQPVPNTRCTLKPPGNPEATLLVL
jgi:hypothetical protein